jgi:methionine biosynthesis protein MetW
MSVKLVLYDNWEKKRNEAFLGLLEKNPNSKVIDLGCGEGDFTLKAKERIGCKEITGIEVYEPSIKKAKDKGIRVIKDDLNKFPYPFNDNTFDVIVSHQVIAHLLYPVKFFREVHRILKSGGYTVVSTENLASWDNLFALLLGYTPFSMEFDSGLYKIGNPFSPHEKEIVERFPPHVRVFAWNGLTELAKLIGFSVERALGSGHILGKIGETIDKRHARFITIKIRK